MKKRIKLKDYIELALKDEKLRRNTCERISDTIKYYGKEKVFSDIFGLEKQKEQIVDFFDRAGRGGSLEERLLLLMGPQGSGKSSMINALAHYYEEYSKTDEGAVYAVKGCPIHEDPLNLVSAEERKELEKKGFHWHEFSNPCPVCKYNLQRGKKAKVERIYISEQEGIGIAKYISADPKTEDITTLIGDIHFKNVEKHGTFYHPKSQDFKGKIYTGNRGFLDWAEIFKSKSKIMTILLELIQSKVVKTKYFPQIFVDTAVIGHTNEAEYKEFISKEIMEPFQGRLHKVDVPYNMDPHHEVKIYEKVIRDMDKGKGKKKHIGPYALGLVASFAIATRKVEGRKDGMQGISPRFIQDVFSLANKPDSKCVGFTDILNSIDDMFELTASIHGKEKEKYMDILDTVQRRIGKKIENDIKGVVVNKVYSQKAQSIYKDYVSAAIRYVKPGKKAKTPQEEKEVMKKEEEDDDLMTEIENRAGIGFGKTEAFRKTFGLRALEEGWDKEAISYLDESKEMKNAIIDVTYDSIRGFLEKYGEKMSNAAKERAEKIKDALKQNGYCEECAHKMLAFLADSCSI